MKRLFSTGFKYLEKNPSCINSAWLYRGCTGKRRGIPPDQRAKECRLGDILRLTEGDLAPVACLGKDAEPCERAAQCRAHPVRVEFYQLVNEYF